METLHQQQQESAPYAHVRPNITMGHFLGHGKLALRGHYAAPYTFVDAAFANAMKRLINRVLVTDPRISKNLEIELRDTREGFGATVVHDQFNHGVSFHATPSLDQDGKLRYEGRIHLLSSRHAPQEVTLPSYAKSAGFGKQLERMLENYLLD